MNREEFYARRSRLRSRLRAVPPGGPHASYFIRKVLDDEERIVVNSLKPLRTSRPELIYLRSVGVKSPGARMGMKMNLRYLPPSWPREGKRHGL